VCLFKEEWCICFFKKKYVLENRDHELALEAAQAGGWSGAGLQRVRSKRNKRKR